MADPVNVDVKLKDQELIRDAFVSSFDEMYLK